MPTWNIVVTDDDLQVLAYISAILRDYTLKLFSSPLDAHVFLNEMQEPPLLLITDIMMPQMNGWELASAFKKRFSKLPVLLISGYTLEKHELPKQGRFLAKPFTPKQLKEVVAALIKRK